jgi:hypothetical protein
MSRHKARSVNVFFFLKNNKHYISRVKVVDDQGKTHKLKDNEVLLKKLNNFYDWNCGLGVDWVSISRTGRISGTCGQLLYGEDKHYNFYSDNFLEEFQPNIQYAKCTQTACTCGIETIMPKFKDPDSKKIIPIYVNRH